MKILAFKCYILAISMVISVIACILAFVSVSLLQWDQSSFLLHVWEKVIARKRIKTEAFSGVIPTLSDASSNTSPLSLHGNILNVPIFIFLASKIILPAYGTWTLYSRRVWHLVAFSVMTYLGVLVLFVILWLLVDLTSFVHEMGKQSLHEMIKSEYEVSPATTNGLSIVANSAMIIFECCGVYGPADMLDLGQAFLLEGSRNVSIQPRFPPACCQRHIVEAGFSGIVKCLKERKLKDINLDGCYENMYAFAKGEYMVVISSVIATVVVVECIQIVTSAAIVFDSWEAEKVRIKKALLRTHLLAIAIATDVDNKRPSPHSSKVQIPERESQSQSLSYRSKRSKSSSFCSKTTEKAR